jgi:hypothetical protein
METWKMMGCQKYDMELVDNGEKKEITKRKQTLQPS